MSADVLGDAGAVVLDDQAGAVSVPAEGDPYGGSVTAVSGSARLGEDGVAGVVHDVEHCPAEVLGYDVDLGEGLVVVLLEGDVEVLVVGPHGVVGEGDVFLGQAAEVGGKVFVLLAAGVEQDVADDAGGPLAVLTDAPDIVLEVSHDLAELLPVVIGEALSGSCEDLF